MSRLYGSIIMATTHLDRLNNDISVVGSHCETWRKRWVLCFCLLTKIVTSDGLGIEGNQEVVTGFTQLRNRDWWRTSYHACFVELLSWCSCFTRRVNDEKTKELKQFKAIIVTYNSRYSYVCMLVSPDASQQKDATTTSCARLLIIEKHE